LWVAISLALWWFLDSRYFAGPEYLSFFPVGIFISRNDLITWFRAVNARGFQSRMLLKELFLLRQDQLDCQFEVLKR
jgi:hypothetical protein